MQLPIICVLLSVARVLALALPQIDAVAGTGECVARDAGDPTPPLDLSNVRLPGDQAPFPVNDDYYSAPEDNTPVPADAVTFVPAEAGLFDNNAFAEWRDHYRDNPPPSKFLKIQPGSYRFKLGTKLQEGDDPNNTRGMNLIMYLMKGGWTLDLRGVTFYVDFTPENRLQRPDVIIYILQSDNLTILGGTIWQDFGELYTQARVTSISAEGTITMQVEEGYNLTKWREAGPRNQGCINDNSTEHYSFPGCNFWKIENYDFSNLETQRTFTAHEIGGSGITVGTVITMMNGLNGYNNVATLANEANTGLRVKGMTSNAGFMSIGLDNGETPPIFEECYTVNPPPRPGFAPRVMGPLISWANTNLGVIYNPEGKPKATFVNSKFQYTANENDFWDSNDEEHVPR